MTKLTAQKMHDAHKELQEIFVKKNTDYGNSFEESLEKHGLIAAIVRMEDKMSRLNTLSKQEALVSDESLVDTLKDLSNYALMSAVWLEGTKKEVDFINKVSQAITTSPLTATLDSVNPNLSPAAMVDNTR
nr:MAG TPA: Nucleotide modification associated domain 1 [Caudoviricetes sp.]